MSTMNISLPDSLKAFVDEQVSQRGYGTSSEYEPSDSSVDLSYASSGGSGVSSSTENVSNQRLNASHLLGSDRLQPFGVRGDVPLEEIQNDLLG